MSDTDFYNRALIAAMHALLTANPQIKQTQLATQAASVALELLAKRK